MGVGQRQTQGGGNLGVFSTFLSSLPASHAVCDDFLLDCSESNPSDSFLSSSLAMNHDSPDLALHVNGVQKLSE